VTRPALLLLSLCAVAGAACRDDTPAPSPGPPSRAAEDPGLRPPASRDAAGAPSLPPGHPPLGGGGAAAAEPAGAAITGTVQLASGLTAPPGHVLFLIARDASRTIAAVRREDGVTYPFTFRLSAADAMTEGTSFAGPLEVTARLSRTGDAIPRPGDLEGTAQGVATGARDVTITVDSTRQ